VLWSLQKKILREAEHLVATGEERKEPFAYALAKAFLHRKRVHTFLALEGGEMVGYITLVSGKFKKIRDTVYIVVGVRASHRGRGIPAPAFETPRALQTLNNETHSSAHSKCSAVEWVALINSTAGYTAG